ncbi:MAG TPA: metal ABC transporter ATP-binding protein [Paracoccus sp. (in: a-proteobacteria)]|uniref:metal ABC transporter ATP-binding protein n=1 Tax=uncultured Paracoccus sp. TaxID=189685 RepID=UPI0026260888|nr:metal ABC transporter ATP-binding protein [uncultured Paracoccus sp.]HMQ39744.1 metal ABC transporter ATP-binding protein [Paracoccus sp. (in: a-proteobacteria)]HMR36347.1 metal ABC transporter ATP-binding protein [Paracoccus sp. (in: a-proteobacteria)]
MSAPQLAPIIAAQGLTVRHRGAERPILSDVGFAIRPGEIVTVVGPNGSGKSTLVRAVLGHVEMEAGEVTRRPGLRIGYVPQRVHIDDRIPMTVRRFLSLPHRVSDIEAAAVLARTGVDGLQQRQITRLSGGQFQRVLLARALLGDPQLLVLDEPTQGLDQPGIVDFYRLIEEIRQETGAAVLMVSHDLLVVMRASDQVICLNGHVCCHGTPQAVSAAPEYQALFGADSAETLALYRHHHDHRHDEAAHDPHHDHKHEYGHHHHA